MSDDEGTSWSSTELPLPPGTPACAASPEEPPAPFAPDVAFGLHGTLYALYVHPEGRGNSRPLSGWPAQVFLPELPSLAAGPEGVLHAAWHDGRNGGEDVFPWRWTTVGHLERTGTGETTT